MSSKTNDRWDFAGIAEGYEKYLVPVLAMWSDELFEMTDLKPDDDVLDVACGTGIVLRKAASRLGRNATLAGVDIEPAMLDVARTFNTDFEVPVEWVESDAAEMPVDDESVDVVYCQQGLQFMPEPARAIEEMHRVLRPGGRMAISVWGPLENTPGYAAMTDAVEKHLGDEPAAMMRAPFLLNDPKSLTGLADDAGFKNADVRAVSREVRHPSPEEFFRREVVSWLAGAIGELDDNDRRAVVSDLDERLRSHIDDQGLRFSMEALIMSARKE